MRPRGRRNLSIERVVSCVQALRYYYFNSHTNQDIRPSFVWHASQFPQPRRKKGKTCKTLPNGDQLTTRVSTPHKKVVGSTHKKNTVDFFSIIFAHNLIIHTDTNTRSLLTENPRKKSCVERTLMAERVRRGGGEQKILGGIFFFKKSWGVGPQSKVTSRC